MLAWREGKRIIFIILSVSYLAAVEPLPLKAANKVLPDSKRNNCTTSYSHWWLTRASFIFLYNTEFSSEPFLYPRCLELCLVLVFFLFYQLSANKFRWFHFFSSLFIFTWVILHPMANRITITQYTQTTLTKMKQSVELNTSCLTLYKPERKMVFSVVLT